MGTQSLGATARKRFARDLRTPVLRFLPLDAVIL